MEKITINTEMPSLGAFGPGCAGLETQNRCQPGCEGHGSQTRRLGVNILRCSWYHAALPGTQKPLH